MDTAGKTSSEEAELRGGARGRALGTQRRAATIETFVERKVTSASRQKERFLATDLGRYLRCDRQGPQLETVRRKLTGLMGAKLKQIEAGKLSPGLFFSNERDREVHTTGSFASQ